MPVPTVITDLSATASSNSPAGGDAVTPSSGPDEYIRAHAAFIKQLQEAMPPVASPTFTGVPAGPTAAPGTNTTQLATTAFVTASDNLKANLTGATFSGAIDTTGANSWTKGQRGAVVALTDATTVATDLALSNNFSLTLAANRTMGNPTNTVAGQSGVIAVTQDGTGSRTLAYAGNWKFASGTAPTLSTAANAVDYLAYYVETATRVFASMVRDVK